MTVVILASGPSLSADQVAHVRRRQENNPRQIATIAINNTHERAPWSTDLYACDAVWWRHYQPQFAGRCWSQRKLRDADRIPGGLLTPAEVERFGIRYVSSLPGQHLDLEPTDTIRTGGNSAFQAVNLAINEGAKRVVLVGVDLQATDGASHWHGDHPTTGGLTNPQEEAFRIFRNAFDNAAAQLKRTNIEFIQATVETALQSWPRMDIETALKEPLNDWRSPESAR